MAEAIEVTVDRIVEELSALTEDKRWISDVLAASDSDDEREVIKTLRHVIRMVENEFDF